MIFPFACHEKQLAKCMVHSIACSLTWLWSHGASNGLSLFAPRDVGLVYDLHPDPYF